jgi:hypothetical protein
MRFLFIPLLYCLHVFSNLVIGQSITGQVADSITLKPLSGVVITARPFADSAKRTTAVSDSFGRFELVTGNGTYHLSFEAPGYALKNTAAMVLNAGKDLGTIFILDLAKNTGTAVITVASPVKQIGDTTEYNAGSFKVNPDATAEDLVKKMPGITVENGTIKAQGEEVKKVTLDGKDFFGDDAQTALRNLPADIVDKIQVFERMSDQAQFTGFDDGQGVKSINIKTKRGKANGTFGKVYAGAGTDTRYQSGLNFNHFKQDRRITVLGMSNNINLQNFTSQDLLGISSSNSGGGGRGGPGGPRGGSVSDNFLVAQSGGISTTHSAGINYSDKWGKKFTVSSSYFFNQTQNNQEQNILRTYNNSQAAETSQLYGENSTTRNTSQNHRFNARLEFAPDTNNSIQYIPTFSLQNTDIRQHIMASNYNAADTFSLSESNYQNAGNGYNFGNNILYRHKFHKTGRTISISLENQWNRRFSEARNSSTNHSFFPNDSVFATDQMVKTESPQNTYGTRISYTEPVGKTGMLQFEYRYSLNINDNDKQTLNFNNSEQTYSNFDTALSNEYHTRYFAHQPSVMYRLRGPKLSLGVGTGFQYAELSGNQIFPVADEVYKPFTNLLPRVFMNYKWNKTTNMRGMFRTSTNIPTIAQLQNVINISNPLLLSSGNSELKQEVSQNLNLNFSKVNTTKLTNFFVGFFGAQTSNYITNATRFLTADTQISEGFVAVRGAQITSPVNLNGYWNTRLFGVYGMPIKKLKSNLNINGTYSIGQKPGLVNGTKNISNTQNISAGLSMSSNIKETVDFSIGYNTNYYTATNSSQGSLNNSYFNNTANGKINYIFKTKLVLNTELNYNIYSGLSSGFDQQFLLWNAAVAYKFMKGNAAEIRLSCFDILAQNRSISRTVTETYIEDNFTKVLSRYLMLTFTVNFKKFENGGTEPKAPENGQNPMAPPPGVPPGRPPF